MRCPICGARVLTGLGFGFHLGTHARDLQAEAAQHMEVEFIAVRPPEHPTATEEEE